MKLKLIGLAALTLAATVVRAQGTAADYKRAYSLQSKFQQKTVAHWAHDIGWKDSSSVLHYYIDTQDGRRYISYDVTSGISKTYNSEREMKKALGMKERRNANGQRTYSDPFRHKEPFWMDTYDEQDQRVVASPDGKLDAWIENNNVYVHEVFVNDGAKSDTGNIGEIVRWDNSIGVTDPIYPVYIDSNVMCGRAGVLKDGKWSNVNYMPCTEENNFTPQIPNHRVDMIYLCYPNNPTGTVLPKEELRRWVNYALKNDTLILYDAAYEAYIQDDNIPHSIYEIKGARKVAIEFRSYSKTAGFTGVRCGYTIIPKDLTAVTIDGSRRIELNHLWDRRQSTKFNGTSYISQRAAEAIYSPEGKKQIKDTINYYMGNAQIMMEALTRLGLKVYGGRNAPYLWVKTPNNTGSWKFFEQMLYSAGVVCTPGVGFGPSGEGYVRLTAFGDRDDCREAMTRIANWLNG